MVKFNYFMNTFSHQSIPDSKYNAPVGWCCNRYTTSGEFCPKKARGIARNCHFTGKTGDLGQKMAKTGPRCTIKSWNNQEAPVSFVRYWRFLIYLIL